MKILCVSDYVDPLVYNQNVKELFPDIDAILCAGDLPMDYIDFIVSVFNKPTYFIFGNHNLKDFGFYHKISSPQGEQQYHQRNNHHSSGAVYLGFKSLVEKQFVITDPVTKKQRPLLIAGASGSLKYNNGLCQYSDGEMKWKLIKMIPSLLRNKRKYGTYLDIFLTHATPRHIHDHEDPCHKGFECFNWFIEKFKPTFLIHGHIHLYDMREPRITEHNGTTVINAYAHHILEIPDAFLNY
ncbi:MAG: metallophosphoesterase [Treponema sp.]|nr:metallophosphoesterase [Treponema sp.]